MAKLTWDQTGQRFYETGTDHGVLYRLLNTGLYESGVAWNGLTAFTDSPSGAEATALYADNQKYLSLMSAEEVGGTLEAYTYPEEFETCDGSAEIATGVSIGQQTRQRFAFSYRTKIGNDVDGDDHGYKIHIVYNALASPSEKSYATINDSPEAITFSWEISTDPIAVDGYKSTASLVIDSTRVDKDKLKLIEDKLYGTADTEPTLLLPNEIVAIVGA